MRLASSSAAAPELTADESFAGRATLDVRGVAPRDRFDLIMGRYESLAVGATLELTVDHDPECMYFTLLGTRGPEAFSFDYLERGPAVWRVRVIKRVEVTARAAAWS